jgi:hypothetical protein
VRLVATAVTLAVVAIAAVMLAGGGSPSIVARAYAAIDSTGVIVHYVETDRFPYAIDSSLRGYGSVVRIAQVWVSGTRSHLVARDHVVGFGKRQTSSQEDIATRGSVQEAWNGENNSIFIAPVAESDPAGRCPKVAALGPMCSGVNNDPITIVRRLYRSGRLHAAGQATFDGRRVDVIAGQQNSRALPWKVVLVSVRVLVDPKTFLPLQVQEKYTVGARSVSATTTISGYQRLPLSDSNRGLLELRPHPGAHVVCGFAQGGHAAARTRPSSGIARGMADSCMRP